MAEPPCDRRWRDMASPALLLGLALVALLTWVVVRSGGNLAWDDAGYLRAGLRIARLSRAEPAQFVRQTLRERPKPPWLAAWIASARLVLGQHEILPLIVAASVVPYALLILAVAVVAARLFGRRAVVPSLLALAASPLSLSFGAKVMVETFLALWLLLTLAFAALLLDRPSPRRARGLGAALGLAFLTKLTLALFLPAAALVFLGRFARRYPIDRRAATLALGILGPLVLLAAPWYFQNGRTAVRFAFFASRFNVLALARDDVTPAIARLAALFDQVAGGPWPILAALLVAVLGGYRRWWGTGTGAETDSPGSRNTAAADFVALAMVAAGSGTVLLLIPAYFDARFLLPIWPALAVCLGGLFARVPLPARSARAGVVVAHGFLVVGLVLSANRLAHEAQTVTYWKARRLIDDLVTRYHVACIGNVGCCGDWNVCKTGMINELRANPDDCFVLHDLSRNGPAELERRLGRFDALVVLDRASLPPGFVDAAPGLNRAYGSIDAALVKTPGFQRVAIDCDGLPPLSVYVRPRDQRLRR
jgi:4-amino-4-deoxy-L-arabinose transferase-like glycosyltransferase